MRYIPIFAILYCFSCNNPRPHFTIIDPIDSVTIKFENEYERVSFKISDNKDSVVTFNLLDGILRIYTKTDNDQPYRKVKEVAYNSENYRFDILSEWKDGTYLLSNIRNGANYELILDKHFKPIDTFIFKEDVDGLKNGAFNFKNSNSDRPFLLNDSVMYFRIYTKDARDLVGKNPFVFYDLKNEKTIPNKIQFTFTEYASMFYAYASFPITAFDDSGKLYILQPHEDSLYVYDWKKQEQEIIEINNYFFQKPSTRFFINPENELQDREEYAVQSFENLGMFIHNSKVFNFFKIPGTLSEYGTQYVMGYDLNNRNSAYFKLNGKHTVSSLCQFTKDKLYIPVFEMPNELSNEQKPTTIHIYDKSQFAF